MRAHGYQGGDELARYVFMLIEIFIFVLNAVRHKLRGPSSRAEDDCEPADPSDTVTDRLNNLLKDSGAGYILRLCPGKQYIIQEPIAFTAPDQEISTLGYPTGDDRATLIVSGPVENGEGHSTAVDGTCLTCSGVKLRNIQVNNPKILYSLDCLNPFGLTRSMVLATGLLLPTEVGILKWAGKIPTNWLSSSAPTTQEAGRAFTSRRAR